MKTPPISTTHPVPFPDTPTTPSPSPLFAHPTVILGAGRLGTALAVHMTQQHMPLLALWNRTPLRHVPPGLPLGSGEYPQQALKQAHVLLLTVSDEAIVPLAKDLLTQQYLRSGQIIVHCSGRLHAQSLVFLEQIGCEVGRMHPLQPISSAVSTVQGLFSGISVGVDGSPQAIAVITELTKLLGGTSFSLVGVDHALYHTAAVFASNYLVGLAHVAQQLMTRAGLEIPPLPLLLPLMEQALQNLKVQGLPQALTGPISRTDRAALQQHVEALKHSSPEYLSLYLNLAKALLPIAREQRPDSTKHQEAIEHIDTWLHSIA